MTHTPQEKLAAVIAFLQGEAPLDGRWFSDAPPEGEGRYWWRKPLREAATLLSEHGGGGEAVGYATQDGGVIWYADGPGSVSRKPAPGTVLYITPPTSTKGG